MPNNQVQIRRDTATNIDASTPANGELGYDTTNKRLRTGDGVTAGGIIIPNYLDAQKNAFTYATAGGTATDLTLTLAKSPGSYVAGQIFRFKAAASSTGATTLNVNALGAKDILKMSAGALTSLSAGDLILGGVYEVVYDGTQFQLLGITPEQPSAAGSELLAIGTAASSATLDFTSEITSEFETYAFVFCGLRTASNADLWCRMSDGGSSGFYSGSTSYAHSRTEVSGTTATESNSNSDTKIVMATNMITSASHGFSGIAYLNFRPTRLPLITWDGAHVVNSGGTFARSRGAGYLRGGDFSACDGVRFLASTGNLFEGTVKMYGLRSAL